MSKNEYLKLKLENNSKDDKFEISLIHFTNSEEFDFEFENSTYWIERGLLEFYDNDIKIQDVELMLINPCERKKTTYRISPNKPFNYNIKGEIIDKGSNILLKMKAISYLLEKNKKYILRFKSEKVVNELEMIF
ncbi:hypothetical protein [Psychroserpens sp. S379A]|uniref:hypothetical protein n=1 Tax=Psychroserpens sp. S379A TaxID=3415137 RepID=UPI003C7D9972